MKMIDERFVGVATSSTRVIESDCPREKRLFDDPFAFEQLPFGWRVLVRLLFLPGLRGLILALRERLLPG